MSNQHTALLSSSRRWFVAVLAAALLLVLLGTSDHAQAIAEDNPAQAAEVQPADEVPQDKPAEEKKKKKNKKDKKEKKNKKEQEEADPDQAEQDAQEDEHESDYFGISTTGKEIIYVLDNSNSMSNGRFNAASDELLTSVKNLREDQSYYVVLFSDTAYPLGHPKPVKGMQKPTEENIAMLEYWLGEVELCLRTAPSKALMASLATKPDTIYLLTDGAFGDDTMKQLRAVKSSKAQIHTIGLNIGKDGAEQDLKEIAEKFRGEYRAVTLDKEKKQKYAEPKRKKNTTRGKVWGLNLKEK